jgi:hypothetical protein
MTDLQVLEEIVKDYINGIEYLHDVCMQNYTELSDLRNKKKQVEKLIKKLSKKK